MRKLPSIALDKQGGTSTGIQIVSSERRASATTIRRRVCPVDGPLGRSNAARPGHLPATPLEHLCLQRLSYCTSMIQQRVVRGACQVWNIRCPTVRRKKLYGKLGQFHTFPISCFCPFKNNKTPQFLPLVYFLGKYLGKNNSPQTFSVLILLLLRWHYSNTNNQIHNQIHNMSHVLTRLQPLFKFEKTDIFFFLSPKQDVSQSSFVGKLYRYCIYSSRSDNDYANPPFFCSQYVLSGQC